MMRPRAQLALAIAQLASMAGWAYWTRRDDQLLKDMRKQTTAEEALDAVLCEALDIRRQDLQAFAAELVTGRQKRNTTAIRPKRLPETIRHKRTAKLVYMRMTNLLWDSRALPIPQTYVNHDQRSGPGPIPRHHLELWLQQIRAPILKLLANRAASPRLRAGAGCLEWGVDYARSVYGEYCRGKYNSLDYESDNQKVVPVEESGDGVRHYKMDLCAKPMNVKVRDHIERSGGFEFVVATQVFEHLQMPFDCMDNLFVMMAPGGVLLLTAPFAYPWHGVPHDWFRYTVQGLASIAKSAGFHVTLAHRLGNQRLTIAQYEHWWPSALPEDAFKLASADPHPKDKDQHYHSVGIVATKPGFSARF